MSACGRDYAVTGSSRGAAAGREKAFGWRLNVYSPSA